jgi:hypothetical protein
MGGIALISPILLFAASACLYVIAVSLAFRKVRERAKRTKQ